MTAGHWTCHQFTSTREGHGWDYASAFAHLHRVRRRREAQVNSKLHAAFQAQRDDSFMDSIHAQNPSYRLKVNELAGWTSGTSVPVHWVQSKQYVEWPEALENS